MFYSTKNSSVNHSLEQKLVKLIFGNQILTLSSSLSALFREVRRY